MRITSITGTPNRNTPTGTAVQSKKNQATETGAQISQIYEGKTKLPPAVYFTSNINSAANVNDYTTIADNESDTLKLGKAVNFALNNLKSNELVVISNLELDNTAKYLLGVMEDKLFEPAPTKLKLIIDNRFETPVFIGLNDEDAEDFPYSIAAGGECEIYDEDDELQTKPATIHEVYLLNDRDKIIFNEEVDFVRLDPEIFPIDGKKYINEVNAADFLEENYKKEDSYDSGSIIHTRVNTPDKYLVKGDLHPNFSDVGGQKKAIQQLEEDVLFPLVYKEALGHTMNKGIILAGPPGTGKTHIARALANEISNMTGTEIKFYNIDGTSLTTSAVGETEAKWRQLFAKAAEEAPSIIFIDEGESVAQNRDDSSNARYDNKTVDQILTLMSNLEKSDDNVFVLMATNKLASLDPAITRDGRFGIIIPVELPDLEGCQETLGIYLRDKNVADDVDLDNFAKQLVDMKVNYATIAGTVERAQRIARRRCGIFDKMRNRTFKPEDMQAVEITQSDLTEALKEVREKENLKSGSRIVVKGYRR